MLLQPLSIDDDLQPPVPGSFGLAGFIIGLSPTSLLQTLDLERSNCVLRLERDGQVGTFYLVDGQIVDAELNGTHGEAVACELLTWKHSRISLGEGVPNEHTINAPLMHLVLEATRRLDEAPQEQPKKPSPRDGLVLIPGGKLAPRSGPAPELSNPESAERALSAAMLIAGAQGAAIIEVEGGATLLLRGELPGFAAAVDRDATAIRLAFQSTAALGLGEEVEEIFFDTADNYQIARPVRADRQFMVYLMLEKSRCNLALARRGFEQIEAALVP
jgi:Domain of unknown function (DUF4388)